MSPSDGRGQKSQRAKSQKTPKTNPNHYFGEFFFISVLKSLISILSNVWVSALESNSKYPQNSDFPNPFRQVKLSFERTIVRNRVAKDSVTWHRRGAYFQHPSFFTVYLVCDCICEYVMLYFFKSNNMNENKFD